MKESIIQPSTISGCCFKCGIERPDNEKHHCLHGSYRKIADQEGLWVCLCIQHHRDLHDKNADHYDEYLKDLAQRMWMKKNKKSKEDFLNMFGKSFILDEV